jgi:hypothetical protein
MERSVDGMKLHREKYSGDFIPYNLPELFQGSEKLEKFTRLHNTYVKVYFLRYTSSAAQDFLKFVGKHIGTLNVTANYEENFIKIQGLQVSVYIYTRII